MCDRFDGALDARAIAEIERLRNELGASDMALEAARSELHRERIAGALDRRATTADAATASRASMANAAYESFSTPIRATISAADTSGLIAGAGAGGNGTDPSSRAPHAANDTIVVRSRSLVDLFA